MTAAVALEDPYEAEGTEPGGEASWTRGQVGTLLLILAESSFFCVFLVAYLFYIGKSASGPQPAEVLDLPILATICLLSSSGTIVFATRGLGAGRIGQCIAGLLFTIVLGGTFLFMTGLEWHRLIFEDGLWISTNLFGTTFYSLVGFHAAHVAVGLTLMTLVLTLSVLGHVKAEHAERVELLSWYWHFVDVVWIAVFTVVYVVGL